MKKSLALIVILLFFTASCGSSHKKGSHAKYRRGGDGHTYYPSNDPLSIDDIIYENLESKHSGGIHYSKYLEQNREFDIPYVHNQYVQKWIDYFTGKGRHHFARYLSRLGRFMPYIHAVTDYYGLPRDLVYLSMIESGFNIRAKSWASAVGPWQFIRSTGAMYGLNVDYYVDERRDVQKATHAAARHLRDLYNEFGHWYLAFAAYNAGPGKVRNAIKRDGSDYWSMVRGRYLRQETKDYVPKILAAAVIAKNPEKYGFKRVNYQTAVPFETVRMKGATALDVAAECAGVDPDLIRLLNPELLRDMTPPHVPNYRLNIPAGTKSRFEKRYAQLRPSERMRITYYTVQRGDTVNSIAKEFGMSEKDLAEANHGDVKISKSRYSKRVKVRYKRHGKRRWRWQTKRYTVAHYSVKSGAKLTIPNNRSLSAYSSSRDDAAAFNAEGKFGKQVAFLDKPDKKEKKENKKTDEKESSVVAVRAKENSNPLPAPEQNRPVKSDLDEIGYIVAGKDNLQRGTPMDLSDSSAGSSAVAPKATAPSDAELKEAILTVRPVPNEPVAQEPAKKQWAEKKLEPKPAKKLLATNKYYRVRRGDTLSQIARHHGVSVSSLKQWNGRKVYPVLKAGSKIVVRQSQVVKYKVKPGDSLIKIARKHSTTAKEIQQMNGLKSHIIRPGAVLVVRSK